MAVNILTFDSYPLPGSSYTNVTENSISISLLASNSNISTNATYIEPANTISTFRGLVSGSYTQVVETTTAVYINVSGVPVSGAIATSLGNEDVYTGVQNNVLQFRGVTAGSYTAVTSSSTSLLVSYSGPIGNSAATSLGSNAVYAGAQNDILQFRGVTSNTTLSVAQTTTNLVVEMRTSGVVSGTYGSASNYPQVVVDTYGRITSISNIEFQTTAYGRLGLNTTSGISISAALLNSPFAIKNLATSWTATALSSEFTMPVDGQLQYNGSTTRMFQLSCSVSLFNSPDGYSLMTYKGNGGGASSLITGAINSSTAGGSIGIYIPVQLATSDYVALYLVRFTGGTSVTLFNAQIYLSGSP